MKNINQALVKFNAQLKPIHKDASNPFFKSDYLTLSGILDAVRPLLSSVGLSIVQPIRVDGDKNILITKLIHESGEEIVSEMILPNHSDVQKHGSLITYYKRYQLQALLGISTADEDDDGNAATQPKPQQTQQRPGVPASDAQKNAMTKMGIKFSPDISKQEASDLIAAQARR